MREVEQDGKLPSLDVEVVRAWEGLKTVVYREAMSSNIYVFYASRHANCIKTGAIKCLAKRTGVVCSKVEATME